MNYFKIQSFHGVTYYDIECEQLVAGIEELWRCSFCTHKSLLNIVLMDHAVPAKSLT